MTATQLRELVARAPHEPTAAGLLVEASFQQLSGKTEKAATLLRSALRIATAGEKPFVIDVLAPIYFMQGRGDLVEALLDRHEPGNDDISRLLLAMRAVAASEAGRTEEARRIMARADARSASGPLAEARLAQRYALVAFHGKDYETAIALAEESARGFGALRAHRLRATSYSILYLIHHSVTRNVAEALSYARRLTETAVLADDRSFETVGLVAQYEIAAECADIEALETLRLRLRSDSYPPQYRERFAARIADFLPLAWNGDFVAFGNGITTLKDGIATTPASKALCHALLALAAVDANDEENARAHSRIALDLANLKDASRAPVYELRYCGLARSLAAAACLLIGDFVRGRRIAASRANESEDDTRALVAVAEGLPFAGAPERIRGYARVVTAVMERRTSAVDCPLTKSELEVIRELAAGRSAAQIASDSMRSIHTVRNHTRAIIAKFQVSGRLAAVAHARRLGIIP